MDNLTAPKAGDPLKATWAQDVVDEIRRQDIIPGNGLRKTKTTLGTVLELDRGKKTILSPQLTMTGTSFLCRIVGGSAAGYWRVQVYPDGMTGEPMRDERGNTKEFYACATELWDDGTNLIGKWVVCHFFPCAIIAGDDQP